MALTATTGEPDVAAPPSHLIHAHPSILHYLNCQGPPPLSATKVSLDSQHHIVFHELLQVPLPCQDLVALALECDRQIYGSNATTTTTTTTDLPLLFPLHPSLQSLYEFGAQPHNDSTTTNNDQKAALYAATTLLALHSLEATIRQFTTSKKGGDAPLLITMLGQMEQHATNRKINHAANKDSLTTRSLSLVLQSLLLPRKGVNLRNLLWHGFCGGLPRPWLALTLCLTRELLWIMVVDQEAKESDEETTTDRPLTMARADFSALLANRSPPGVDDPFILAWLPESHHGLWRLAQQWQQDGLVAIPLALYSVLLEHGLRRSWCRANARPDDAVAQPYQYYVTLDGHGRRHVHELLLYPYIGTEETQRNVLVAKLGGPCTALLRDLFCAPYGPNLRAALAHGGIWDDVLWDEMTRLPTAGGSNILPSEAYIDTAQQRAQLQEYTHLVLVGFQEAARACVLIPSPPTLPRLEYQPQFSHTSTTRQSLLDCQAGLASKWRSSHDNKDSTTELPDYLQTLQRVQESHDLEDLLADEIQHLTCGGKSTGWSVAQIYQEYDLNHKLCQLGAVERLARDVADAWIKLDAEIEDAQFHLNNTNGPPLSERKRRRYHRIVTTCARVGDIFYRFASLVVVVALQDSLKAATEWSRGDHLKLVERTRMVVSTVSTFLTGDTERACKAIDDYSKGKVLKQLLLEPSETSS